MKTQTINRNEKVQTLSIATVRALLKKAGYTIGSWGANGRIKGMSNFYGGDLEVKGNEYDWKNESCKSKFSDTLWVHTWTKFVNIEVKSWKNVDIKDIANLLTKSGLKVKRIDIDRQYLIVDNK